MDRNINHENSARQLIKFNGLEWGKKSFTDMDATMEIAGRYLILVEVKNLGHGLNTGQKTYIQNVVDRWMSPQKYYQMNLKLREELYKHIQGFDPAYLMQDPKLDAYGFQVTHNQPSTEDILLKDCNVKMIYHNGMWKPHPQATKFGEIYEEIMTQKWKIEKK